jgi:arylsulfatase A-like enzyme
MREDRPNIVYILADDMGYGDMRCNSPACKIPTPNLDRLAAQGMRFTDAHASSAVCTPSRYAILTGRYAWRTPLQSGVLWPWDPPLIEPDRLNVAELLRQHGYQTACIGKWHLGWEWATLDGEPAHKGAGLGVLDRQQRHEMERNIDYTKPMRGGPIDRGFDTYFGVDVPNFPPYAWFEGDRLTALPTEEKPDDTFGLPGRMVPGWALEEMIPALARRAIQTIEESGPAPLFLYFPLTSPHTPIVPNAPFIGTSGVGLYGDFVCEVDWVVGEVMDALERKGIVDDTLLVFTSDNGPECIPSADGGCYARILQHRHYSMAHFRGVKRDAWEGGHRVPLIARWPAVIPSGTVCDQLVGLIDLLATCADVLDTELPAGEGQDSVSTLPLLQGEVDTPIRDAIVYHSASGKFALRRHGWVFINAPSGDDNQEPEWFKAERGYTSHGFPGELFDLQHDISQARNRYGECPEVVQALAGRLDQVRLAPSSGVWTQQDGPQSE